MPQEGSVTQRRKERERENRRRLILEVAERLMQASGQLDLNMDQVAKETQLAKGTIYLHFKSRDEILTQLTIKVRRLLLSHMQKATVGQPTPLAELEAFLWACFDLFGNNRLYYNLLSFHESGNHTSDTPELKQSSLDITAHIVDILDRARANKQIKPSIDSVQQAFVFWGTIVGMIQLINAKGRIMSEDHRIASENLFKIYVQTIISGIS